MSTCSQETFLNFGYPLSDDFNTFVIFIPYTTEITYTSSFVNYYGNDHVAVWYIEFETNRDYFNI